MLRKTAYGIAISLLLLTPFIYSDELYNGVISAKQIWFYGAMALLMLVTAVDLIFDRRSFVLRFNKIDLALLAFYTYYTIRAATTPYMPLLHIQRWINWSLCVVMYFIIKRIKNEELIIKNSQDNERIKNEELRMNNSEGRRIFHFSFFIFNFLILTALGQAIWGLLQLYGFLPSFNSYFKITGTFFNPAPYAMYLSVIFPMALGKALYNEKNERNEKKSLISSFSSFFNFFISSFINSFIPKFTVIATLLVLPATMIRAAWLAAAVGSLMVAWPWLKQHTRLGSWILVIGSELKYKIAALIIALAVIGGTCTALFYLKKDSAIGKLFIWEVTLGKIAEKQLFGYGVGRFEAEYNNWQAEYFMKHPEEMDGPKGWVAGNTKYCFNEFLEIWSEVGIIGLALFFLFLLNILIRINYIGSASNFFRSIFINILVCTIFSFPFYSSPTFIITFLFIALISSNNTTINIGSPIYIIKYSDAILISILATVLSTMTYNQYRAFCTWDEAKKLYEANSYNQSEQLFNQVYQALKFNGHLMVNWNI